MRAVWGSVVAAALTLGGGPLALAQDTTRGETVMERSRPELDPLGVHLGGFQLFPSVGVAESYRDNVFDTEGDKQSDAITDIRPALRLQSNWSRHALTLFSDARVGLYADHSNEDFTDYTVGGRGRLDVIGRSHLDLGSSYNQRHEDRSSPDDVRGIEPTQYTDTNVAIGGTAAFNRVIFGLKGVFDRYDFSNALSSTGATINNQDRDRDETEILARAGYEVGPFREVFVRGGYNRRSYESARDDNGFARSSNGYEISIGADYDLTGVTSAEVFVGYRRQSYDDVRLNDATGVGAGAKLIWNVTKLTTITGDVTREVEESTIFGASSYFATRGGLRVDHELLRNLILHVNALYGEDAYQGISRNDQHAEAGFGAIYQMNRHFSLAGDYAYRARMSNTPGADFTDNIFTVRAIARY